MKHAWDFDRDPLGALSRGDASLFEAFVRQEAGALVAFFVRRGADGALAEDLTQEVFIKLFQHAQHYEPRGSFVSFALAVARNAWVDHRRRVQARLEPSQEAHERLEDRGPRPGEQLALSDEARRVQDALARLDAAHAVVFELAVIQGRPYADIARALSIPEGTVKSRVFHAVRKLRSALEAPPLRRGPAVAGESPGEVA